MLGIIKCQTVVKHLAEIFVMMISKNSDPLSNVTLSVIHRFEIFPQILVDA